MSHTDITDSRDAHAEFTEASLYQLQETKQRLTRKSQAKGAKTSWAKSTVLEALRGHPFAEEDEEIEFLHPDISLEDGQELAPGQFRKKLVNKVVEDLDPYYTQHGIETFCLVTKRFGKNYVYRFSALRSLFVFSVFNPLRYWLLRTVIHPAFDAIILAIILVNCVFLALDNEIESAEFVFTALYTLEMIMKIVARGFALHPFSYLRDPWNWLDFVVVVLAYATLAGSANVSGLRAFRVLRAFKSVSIIPGLRIIVNSLLNSVKLLGEVLLIMLFLVVVVALIALQAYQGVLRRRCVRYPTQDDAIIDDAAWQSYVTNESNWNPVDGEEVVCGNHTGSGFCPTNYICLGGVADNPNYGITNFDHMGFSLLTSFQLITLDFWENVYNMVIRAEGPWNILFFLVSVFLGPFYLLNLLLAVITLAYSKEVEKQQELKENLEEAQKQALKKKQARKKNRQVQGTINSVSPGASNDAIISEPQVIANSTHPDGSNDSAMHNAEAAMRREMFKAKPQNISVETDDSMSSTQPKWKERWQRTKTWYLDTFCFWRCSLCFDDFQTILLLVSVAWILCCFYYWSTTTGLPVFYHAFLQVVEHKVFEYAIMFSIIANTVFLAIDHHGITAELESALNTGNTVFTVIFTVEATLKILALGPVTYAKSLWNDFDFIIVMISLIELILELTGSISGGTGLSVLRTLRLLRVFRLARMWGTMQKLVEIIWKTLGAVGYLTIVLFLILYIFAVIGKQLYGSQYAASASKFDDNMIPRWNFVDFYHSFLLVWRVMCGEWIEPLHECLHITNGDGLCIVLFLLIFFISNFLVLNLFTAILLAAFNVDNIKDRKEKQETAKKQKRLALKVIAAFRDNAGRKKATSNAVNPEQPPDYSAKTVEQTSGNQKRRWMESFGANSPPSTNIYELTLLLRAQNKQGETKSQLDDAKGDRWKRNVAIDASGTRSGSGRRPESGLIYPNPSVVPNSENWQRKANGHLSFSHTSLRSSHLHSVSFCSKFYCCCYTPHDQNALSVGRSRATSVSRNSATVVQNIDASDSDWDSRSSGSVSTTTVRQTEEEAELTSSDWLPPDCLPSLLSGRYPALRKRPKSAVYNYWMKIRTACFKVVSNSYFEWFILLLILASTVSLAMEDAFLDSDPVRKQVLQRLEYVFTALFTLEMILKWIGLGLTSYFTSVWCLLDCGIVAVSWAGIILQATNQATQTGAFRSLRTLRALRPLRAVSRWEGMRVVVNSLIYCIPSIGNVLCVCVLIWFVFGIMGVQFFKGRFYRCADADGETVFDPAVLTRADCVLNNYTWINPNIHFDNVVVGMLALFQVATFEGWIEVMSDASDITGVDLQPIRENSQYNIIFFVVFVLVGSFFILNLIIGVIIESFQKLKKQTDSTPLETLMTESQKQFYQTVKTMLNNKPKESIPRPKRKFQRRIYRVVTHTRFELFIFVLICLNMVTLGMEHYQMSQAWRNGLMVADIVFTCLFAIEATAKIIGLREYYFKDAFNVFDFIVVAVSIAGFILESLISLSVSPTLLRIVRVFRVFRVLRVIRAARGIRRLILTLLVSVPALFNIAILLGVFLIIFAILGMNSFMNVRLTGALNDQVNFKTFANSILLLFRLLTSAGWNDVLDPLMNTRDCTAASANSPGDCGDPVLAAIYFVLLIFLVFLVIVNMYIAIILENFEDILQQDESGITSGDFEEFYAVWAHYDPDATQFVTLKKLSNLLDTLRPPFRIQKPNEIKISALELPLFSGERVHCLDVLFALVKRILGDVQISPDIKEQAEAMLAKYFPNRKELEANTTTLILRNQIRAARMIQNAWRARKERRENPQPHAFSDLMSQVLPKKLVAQTNPANDVIVSNETQNLNLELTAEKLKEDKACVDVRSKANVVIEETNLAVRPNTVHSPVDRSAPIARPHSVPDDNYDRPNKESMENTQNNAMSIRKPKLQNFVTENGSTANTAS